MPRKTDIIRMERAKQRALSDKQKAEQIKAKYDSRMEGKKTVLVPHPEIPKTWIVKYIDK